MQEFGKEEVQEKAAAIDELGVRAIVPLSDAEIIEIYLADEHKKLGYPADRAAALRHEVVRQAQITDMWIIGSLVFLLTIVWFPMHGGLSILIPIFVVLTTMRAVSKWTPTGPVSYLELKRILSPSLSHKRKNIDPHSEDVLNAVVGHLTKRPLAERDRLLGSVTSSRRSLEISLERLRKIVSALNLELETTQDASLRLLVESKRDAAVRCTRQLKDLDRELRSQAERATAAVAPLEEMRDKFDRLLRVSNSLNQIQQAHGLAEEIQVKVDEHRLQLQLLQTVSYDAMAKLHEIESIVQAKERAKAELENL